MIKLLSDTLMAFKLSRARLFLGFTAGKKKRSCLFFFTNVKIYGEIVSKDSDKGDFF